LSRATFLCDAAAQDRLCRLIVELSTLHAHTHTVCTIPLKVLSARRSGCYPHNTQQHKETNIYALGGIRTSKPTIRALVDLCLTQHGHRDRRPGFYLTYL